jgi:hypothetical protein
MSTVEHTVGAAWNVLEDAVVTAGGRPVGTVAARDAELESLNYDQVFTRDFAVSAFAFLAHGEHGIVREFLITLAELQSREYHMDCFRAGAGLMPASFAVEVEDGNEVVIPDFGERAIGRVTPVDSGMWWLYILRAYTVATGDRELLDREDIQGAVRLILDLCLTTRFETLPTMLVPDGASMIDRRMGVYGHPIDVQSLFVCALRSALEVLEEGPLRDATQHRLGHLGHHIRKYYWLNFDRLNQIHRFEVEELGETVDNPFNVYPATIPNWLPPWLPDDAGYFVGNLGPARIDFRWFAHGNLLAVLASLATEQQTQQLLRLVEERWDDLIGSMPLKVCYPALRDRDWELLTGSDPKNIPWSYHNGGSWPFLIWMLTAAAIRGGRSDLAERALELAAGRLTLDRWPEYYDGPRGRLVGRRARSFQTWTAAGFVLAHQILRDPSSAGLVMFDAELEVSGCSLQGSSS